MTLHLILSGDIPSNKQKSPTCSTCNKAVCNNSKKASCTVCRSITHLDFTTSNKKFYLHKCKCFTFLQSERPSYVRLINS